MPEQHAAPGFGGSTATRTLYCPGWRHLAADLPKGRPSEYALEGSRLHGEIERVMRGEAAPRSEKVHTALEQYRLLLRDAYGSVDIKPHHLEVELRVELDGVPGARGTLDLGVDPPAPHPPLLLDWKFGDGHIVSARANDQLQFYANGWLDQFEDIADDEPIYLGIVQPHDRGGPQRSLWRTTAGDLRAWKQRFAAALEQDHLCAGSWCQFCPVKPTCPELRRSGLEALNREPAPQHPAEVAENLDIASKLERWIKAVREHAQELAEEKGHRIPGWKLVSKRAQRKWVDTDAVWAWLREVGQDEDEAAPRVLLSPAKMATICDIPEELVEYRSSGLTLAPEDDPREPVQPATSLDAFADLHRQYE